MHVFSRQVSPPGDFVTKMKQINSQSDFIWRSSFAGPSYLTIRLSSVYIILMWDLCISIFTTNAKLDPIIYVGDLSNMHSITMNKQ